jgi:PAS domain S-box-containing protein
MLNSEAALDPIQLKLAIVRNPLVVSPNTNVREAISKMSATHLSCETERTEDNQHHQLHLEALSSCVVIVDNEKVMGILTERDMVRLLAEDQPLAYLRVEQVMSPSVVTIKEAEFTDIFFAINLLKQHRIRHLPILDDRGQLVGLVTHESLRQISRPIDLLRLREAQEVMSGQVICATTQTSLLAISQLMASHRVSSVVIVENRHTATGSLDIPVGIITERDLVQFHSFYPHLRQYLAEDLMSRPIFAVKPQESLWVVQQTMEQHLIQRVVVTGEQGELLGIVTQTSLLQALNPLELYKLVEVLEGKVNHLEAQKVVLLESRNSELEEQVQVRTAELQAQREREKVVADMAKRIRNSLDLQEVLEVAVGEIRRILSCDRVVVCQFQEDGYGRIIAESVDPQWRTSLGNSIADLCFPHQTRDRSIVVNNVYTAGYTPCYLNLLEEYQVKANLVIPLTFGDQPWGFLISHQCGDYRDWTEEEVSLLEEVGVQLAIAIQQASTHQKLAVELRERQQAESLLRESQQRYASLAESLPVGVFRADKTGQWVYVNQRWCELAGLSETASMGNRWLTSVHRDDRERVENIWVNGVKDHCACELEFRLQRLDGSIYWVYAQSTVERNSEGKVIGYVGSITDISDRKHIEEDLKKATALLGELNQDLENRVEERTLKIRNISERLELAVSSAQIGIWEWNIAQNRLTWDRRMYCLYGLDPSNPTNTVELWQNALYPEDAPAALESLQAALRGEKKFDPEFRVLHSDGSVRWLSATAIVERDEQGNPQRMIGINRDITQAKIDSQQRQVLMQELANFKLALDQAAIVAITDAQGVITYANDRFCEISGYTQAEIIGQTHRLIKSEVHPPEFFQNLWQTVSRGEIWRAEVCNRAKNGRLYWVDTTVVPFLDAQGKPFQYLAIRVDISDRKQAELALSRSNQLLNAVSTAQAQFITAGNRLTIFEGLLSNLLELTDSEYGFIGEVRFRDDGSATLEKRPECDEILLKIRGVPYVKTHSITNISWDRATQEFYEQNYEQGMEFGNMNTLFGAVVMTGKPVIANSPRTDPRRGGTPDGHPPLNAFLGLPFYSGSTLLGIVGIANRPQGYNQQIVEELEPFLITCSNLIEGYRLERQRQETEEENARQLASIEAAVDGIALLKGDRYEYLNRAHVQIFGYDRPEELIGENWRQLYSEQELKRFEQEVFPVLLKQGFWKGEAIATRKDGSTFDEDLSLTLTEDGTLICVCRDITDYKRSMAALEQTTQQLDRFFSLALDLLCMANREGEFIRLNSQWEKTLGYPISELEGKKFLDYVHPEDLDSTLEAMVNLGKGEELINFTNRYRCRDGSYRWIEWRSRPYGDFIYAAARDITDRKEAQAQLQQQMTAIEAAIDGIGILKDDCYIFVNQAHLSLFNFTDPQDLLGQSWRKLYAPEQIQYFEEQVFPALSRDRQWRGKTIALREGEPFAQELSLTLTDKGYLICVCRDISDRQAAEEALLRTNQELARATRLKDEFLANMSHELRTPLNAILGMTEGLSEQIFGEINDRQLKALNTIERSGSHLLELINDILDVAKIESGKIELEYNRVPIAPLCSSSLAFVKQQAQKKGITLETAIANPLPDLWVDERRLRQVLINLLNNAVKFTPEGGKITLKVAPKPALNTDSTLCFPNISQIETLHPEVKCQPQDPGLNLNHYLRIAIIDTGIGITPENLEKLFQPFVQIDSALNRKYTGTGLGLALVKQIVELHGGQVSVRSKVGLGSCFSIDLPCLEGPDTPVNLPPELDRDQNLPTATGSKSPLILLVDDNEANVTTLSSYLKAKGYQLCIGKNGSEGVALAASERPDMILMDIQMPEMDGLEAIQKIRQDLQLVEVPIIALTALAMDQDRDRALEAGANEYLSKPVKLKQLVATIEQLLANLDSE